MKGSLQTLTQYQKTHVMDQETVLQLGVDICQYLKRGVPHGEIRSSGILVSEDGEFILKEENLYREPDPAGDVYALGMLMYRLLNAGRLPFMPPSGQPVSEEEKERAIQRCLAGEPLPDPEKGGPQMGEVLRKACHADRRQRYQTARELETALIGVWEQKPDESAQNSRRAKTSSKSEREKDRREDGRRKKEKEEKTKRRRGVSLPEGPSFSLGQIGRRSIFVFLSVLVSLAWIILEHRMTIVGASGMFFYGYCIVQGVLVLIALGAGGMFLTLLWGVSCLGLLFAGLYAIVLAALMSRYGVILPEFYQPGLLAVMLPLAAGLCYFAGSLLKGSFGYGQARFCTLLMTGIGMVMLLLGLTGVNVSFLTLDLYPGWSGVLLFILGILAMENEWSGGGVKLLCFLVICMDIGLIGLNSFQDSLASFAIPVEGAQNVLAVLMIFASAAAWFLLGRARNRRSSLSN